MTQLPINCLRCGEVPSVMPISVTYTNTAWKGLRAMFRVQCPCGAIGKCQVLPAEAVESWNQPWQAFVEPSAELARYRAALIRISEGAFDCTERQKGMAAAGCAEEALKPGSGQ